MNTGHAIQVRNVCKSFSSGDALVRAVKNVTLTLDYGEMVAIVGPSGSGKSTLLNIIGLIISADEGSFVLDGKNTVGWDDSTRCRVRNKAIGYVFQDFALLEDETVRENIRLPLYYNKDVPRREYASRIKRVASRLGIDEKLDICASKLSGGQRQRTAIARALVNDQPIVLADEPTGQLDAENREMVVGVFSKLAHDEHKLIVVVTHDLEVAARCDRIITMHDGCVYEERGNEAREG